VKSADDQAWIYISRLNAPITLLHCSQSASLHPFLLIKILENSQISIATMQYSPSSQAQQLSATPPDDIICSAPDALIPHGQWVHFALNLRHPKGGEYGEARLYVNGSRVGAMRMAYPIPIPPPPTSFAPQSQSSQKPASTPEMIRISLGGAFGGTKVTSKADGAGKVEDNEWLLGRTMILEEAMAEDLVLLSHHLVSVRPCLAHHTLASTDFSGTKVHRQPTRATWQIPHLWVLLIHPRYSP
jgi:hypothetical protein